jgi:hypothetical protein
MVSTRFSIENTMVLFYNSNTIPEKNNRMAGDF